MRKALGYALIILGIFGLIGTALILAYLLLIIVIWCPLQACLPQFVVVLVLGSLSCLAFILTLNKGTKLISRRKSM